MGSIAFVPTMGALHNGHLLLVAQAKQAAERTVVSIFVNPGQFGPNEDFDQYPRTIESDLNLLHGVGVDAVFLPTPTMIYPEGYSRATRVKIPRLGAKLCGRTRPHFFEGVCSVVVRLVSLINPSVLLLGEKDYQQLQILRRIFLDLFWTVKIVPVGIVRESDGLAMSSRNRYLSPIDRTEATHIFRAMESARDCVKDGERRAAAVKRHVIHYFSQIQSIKVDYVEIVEPSLVNSSTISAQSRLVVAVWVEGVRLIDNTVLCD